MLIPSAGTGDVDADVQQGEKRVLGKCEDELGGRATASHRREQPQPKKSRGVSVSWQFQLQRPHPTLS